MQAGGTHSSSRLGEEEKELYEQKLNTLTSHYASTSMYSNYDGKKPSSIADPTSLANVSSIGPVSENMENVDISCPTAADSVSDDTGSEDSRINSDEQPLLPDNYYRGIV